MSYLVGFDPGGEDAFGWCVAKDSPSLPLEIVATGIAPQANARSAVNAVAGTVSISEVIAIGIDAPMFWSYGGDRDVDHLVRSRIMAAGAHNGGVQAINSMQGACLAQGIMCANLMRQRKKEIRVTEAHPKALLWLLGLATPENLVGTINLLDLDLFEVPSGSHPTDHERDAALACLSAHAMTHRLANWEDIAQREADPWHFVPTHPDRPEYWVPFQSLDVN